MTNWNCLKPVGEKIYILNVLERTEHLEELSSSEAVVLACLFVKDSLTFSVLLPPPHTAHCISKKADFINMHQNFNLLLWGN